MKPLNIAFIHPDLGIGGAERLVVDAALGLQSKGHNIMIYTSHHDASHCFPETIETLKVTVIGDWLPRHIFGLGHILFAIARSIVLALTLLYYGTKYDVMIVDQMSASVPILRYTGAKILFYCHFPDYLLSKRTSLIKRLYRMPIDYLEEITTRMSDSVLVNSKFTQSVFKDSFRSISASPKVLYPGLPLDSYDKKCDANAPDVKLLKRYLHVTKAAGK
jgi:alpha-1,3/alpha-1,6-mannosyltransferase